MNRFLLTFLQNKFEYFQQRSVNAQNVQKEYLFKILSNNQNSLFGKEHNFKLIYQNKSVSKFQNLVPIRDYLQYQSKIQTLLDGTSNVLTDEKVIFYNLTSGTTNIAKHIPVTSSFHKESKNLLDTWIGGLLKDHPTSMDGYRLAIPGKAIEGYSNDGVPIGSASGRAYKSAPWFIRNKYAIPYEIFEEMDYDLRYLFIIRTALTKDITFIATPNSGTILQLLDKMAASSELILKSLYDGGFNEINKNKYLHKIFKPDPTCALRFEKNLKSNSGNFDPLQHWNNLKMISVWLGGTCGSQVSKLKTIFPSVPMRDLGFHASEARMSVPFQDQTSEGILAFENNFYEFIPRLDYENGNINCLGIGDLEVGKEYYIIITNTSGLYRYDLGDVIQVTDFFHEAPIIKFLRKSKDMYDLVGEKLHINHFLFARESMKQELVLHDERFIIYPSQEYNGYELFCEIVEQDSIGSLEKMAKKFDNVLQIANLEYKSKRLSNRLNVIRIFVIPKGMISSIIHEKFQKGVRDSQYKWNYFTTNRPSVYL